MKAFRILLVSSVVLTISACGTKAPLVTPECSKEERADTGAPAPVPSDKCGKLAKGQKNPSEPNNPISR